ncbi:hypothetical protein C0991_010239 [Blastosporella zonata]|nr:hypothetical protein C0991_010239 [Blastosporella zonata]
MPARSPPPVRGVYTPPNDIATYRDLLLFEERLKSNATNLQSRKSRYQLFLFQLLLVIAFLLAEVLLPPNVSLLVIPYRMLLRGIYTEEVVQGVYVHPYVATGMLFVSGTTLVLFFASGMYEEKILYANKYVPHANRALRSFNMYLNVRKPSLRSKLRLNPLAFFFPRPPPASSQSSPSNSASPSRSSTSPSSTTGPVSRTLPTPAPRSMPIPSIPPATNPRGELIFSSRVDRAFREGYDRHRAAFERRREERERERRRERGWGVQKWAQGWFGFGVGKGGESGKGGVEVAKVNSKGTADGSKDTRSSNPRKDRKPPALHDQGEEGGIMMKQRDRESRSRSPGARLR